MIIIEGREFGMSKRREAVAFLEGILLDLDRHAMVVLDGHGLLLDHHEQLQEILDNEPIFYVH
jgi:hypothetical protein